MIRLVKKSYFTLLEIIVVLFIISFGLILTGVKIKELYQEQRFLSESQQVLSHLGMAQDLMLIMDTDVRVKFTQDAQSKHITFWLEVEKPLEENWARFIERKVQLSAIQSYTFEGSHQDKDLTLQFSLGRMSKGILNLFEGQPDDPKLAEKKHFQIELLGYPSPLVTSSVLAKEQNKIEKSQLLYPFEVYEVLDADSSENNSPS